MILKLIATALTINVAALTGAIALDEKLPAYQPVGGISGQIKSVGSDTLNHEMELWANGFQSQNPGVKIEIEGKGSATAPPALLEGISQFAPMSRPMTADEIGRFESQYGYKPAHFRVAVDALAIYVNKENPIQCLSDEQLDRIFSSTRKGSGGKNIKTWGDVGLTGDWATKPISLYGRNTISGTYEFFRQIVLFGGDYKDEVKQQEGSAAVVTSVAEDKFAIGYSGLGYKTDGVRTVPLATYDGGNCYGTTAEATYSGQYPIARFLYIYVNKSPNEPLDATRAEFIKYILSRDGQAQTEKGGYFSIIKEMREQDLNELGISTVSN
jgi:phosphate transport system substrate-binding protein